MARPRWLDATEQRAWRSFIQSQSQLNAVLGRELQQQSELSVQDYAVLVTLSESPGGRMRPNELAKALAWEKSRLSHQVTRMAKRGQLRRERCPTDDRGSFVALTPEGSRAISSAAPGHVASVRSHFIEVLSVPELEALTRITEKVLAALGEQAPDCAAET
ncbi:MAG: MarR family winged helix-turn-helix transcriptional regulator [Acidimicrobiales bacterium]